MTINKVDEALEKLKAEYGGNMENFYAEREAILTEAKQAWNSDDYAIGKVLRSHLYVEYYLNEYLKKKNIVKHRVLKKYKFSRKVQEIPSTGELKQLIASIKYLNDVRNRMSHDLGACVNKTDSKYFFDNTPNFKFYYSLSKINDDENPVDVYELHALFIAQEISNILNPKQYLINDVLKATKLEIADIRNQL